MSLSLQINLTNTAALDGSTELTTSTPMTRVVDGEGVLVVTLGALQPFGLFDPGVLMGGQRPDYYVQSVQVSSTGGTPGGSVQLVGPSRPPGGPPVTSPRFDFVSLDTLDNYVEVMRAVPPGYKLAFSTTSTGPHVIRLVMWPLHSPLFS